MSRRIILFPAVSIPSLTDKTYIRALLNRDRVWGLYALGDLAPPMFAHTQWFTPDLTLVLRVHGTCILYAMGAGSVREALDHVEWPVHLQVQEDTLAEIARHAVIAGTKHMWRMRWTGAPPAPPPGETVTRLDASHVDQLLSLYADGNDSGEAPDFFFPAMMSDATFYGIFEDRALVAAAGTHLVSRDEGIAAIGNVYTRRDRRGRGYGRAATAAVLHALQGIETIGLNVRADNDGAITMYERLGFVRHCPFTEALTTGPAR
jgi:ribosomal protein S18 acetylase RimI-like enzyme